MDDEHVEDCVAVGILEVRIGTFGHDEPVAFLLTETGRKGQRILAPVHVTKSMPKKKNR